jgi:hypothetical protein
MDLQKVKERQMPYIGKSPVGGGFHKLDSLTASATATYALTLGGAAYYPETANQLLVSLNGVIQAPQDSFTVSGSNLVFDSALTASDSIDFVVALGDVLGVGTPTDGTITTAKIANNAVTMDKLATSGTLPALDGSALTGISSGIVKTAISRIDTVQSVTSTTQAELADFGSFTPSLTTSTIYITGNALIGPTNGQYCGYKWVIDGVDYLGGTLSSNATAGFYANNGYMTRTAPLVTSVSNTDGSAITVALHARSASGTVYLNRSQNQTDANNASQGISEIMFMEAVV